MVDVKFAALVEARSALSECYSALQVLTLERDVVPFDRSPELVEPQATEGERRRTAWRNALRQAQG